MSNKLNQVQKWLNTLKKQKRDIEKPLIIDVREKMPNYQQYKNWQRQGKIEGIAIHHSATAHSWIGKPTGEAKSFFSYQVNTLGWTHGGYNYIISSKGEIEYALDEKIAPFHAGFRDQEDSFKLEFGQYWNNHYIAICLSGCRNGESRYKTLQLQ